MTVGMEMHEAHANIVNEFMKISYVDNTLIVSEFTLYFVKEEVILRS